MASPSINVDDPHLQNYIRKVVYEATGESLLNLPVPEGLDRNLVLNWRKDSQRGREVDLREEGRQYVAIIVRAKEAPGSIALLTREAKHSSFFFPSGKREATDDSLTDAALRELAEECGYVPPSDCPVKLFKKQTIIRDNVENYLYVYAIDVPLSHLISNIRDAHVANEMIMNWIQEGNTVGDGDEPTTLCPMSNLHIPHASDSVTYDYSPYNYCVNYSILVGIDKLLRILTTNSTLGDLPMRYAFSESPLWKIALEIFDCNVPVSDWSVFPNSDVDELSTSSRRSRNNPPRDGPKVDTISGDDHFKLYQWTLNLPAMLTSRKYDPNSVEAVDFVVRCFTGNVLTWYTRETSTLNRAFSTVNDLVNAIHIRFIGKNFPLEQLSKLRHFTQGALPLGDFIIQFNQFLSLWFDDFSVKAKVYFFVLGLNDPTLRGDLLSKFRSGGLTDLESVQEAASQTVADRTFGGGNARRPQPRQDDGLGVNPSSGVGKPGKPGKPGKHGKPGKPNKPGKPGHIPKVLPADAPYEQKLYHACRAKWPPQKATELWKKKLCMNCGKDGHMLLQCPQPKPNV